MHYGIREMQLNKGMSTISKVFYETIPHISIIEGKKALEGDDQIKEKCLHETGLNILIILKLKVTINKTRIPLSIGRPIFIILNALISVHIYIICDKVADHLGTLSKKQAKPNFEESLFNNNYIYINYTNEYDC